MPSDQIHTGLQLLHTLDTQNSQGYSMNMMNSSSDGFAKVQLVEIKPVYQNVCYEMPQMGGLRAMMKPSWVVFFSFVNLHLLQSQMHHYCLDEGMTWIFTTFTIPAVFSNLGSLASVLLQYFWCLDLLEATLPIRRSMLHDPFYRFRI